ncbi:hypothetical protein BC937DRAFT_86440 [Endogone sp. FLAS-F59071]|nr:hypothetical protein BC937DRAFT_86440 [Endogone sp. FLAS-F59071]|eukprot:RUS20072.1 hypothetical protein BC937DRAFT_86440 [Endogone sp. FLAS-F59071]
MSRFGTDEKPVDTIYYDLLQIPVSADDKLIKKQYRLLAMKYHPDKNKEEGAEEMFKQISEAYQILSDPQLRAAYNKYGKDDKLAPANGFADPQAFFQQMFGGDAFKGEQISGTILTQNLYPISGGNFTKSHPPPPATLLPDIIGELTIGRELKEFSDQHVDPENGTLTTSPKMPTKEEMLKRKQAQEERVRELSEKLVHKLSLYTESEGDEIAAAAFEEQIRIEADALKEESYGVELLHAIGHTYSSKAKQFLGMKGGELPKIFQQIREKKHVMKEFFSMVKSVVDVQQTMVMLQKAEQRGILRFMWQTSKVEVEGILRQVCERVLNDTAVSKKVQYRRAEALRMMGVIYKNVVSDSTTSELAHMK